MKFAIFIALIHLNLANKKKRLSREMFAFLFYVQQQFTKLISKSSLALCEWYCMSSRSSSSSDCLHKTFRLINLNTENFTTPSHHIILRKRHKTFFFCEYFPFLLQQKIWETFMLITKMQILDNYFYIWLQFVSIIMRNPFIFRFNCLISKSYSKS